MDLIVAAVLLGLLHALQVAYAVQTTRLLEELLEREQERADEAKWGPVPAGYELDANGRRRGH